jgi:hypothetical protein
MRQVLGLAAVGILLVAGSATAMAQQAPAASAGRTNGQTEITRPAAPAPAPKQGTFTLFGIPVQVAAPVQPSYANSQMQTYGGQPARGMDVAIERMNQSLGGPRGTTSP